MEIKEIKEIEHFSKVLFKWFDFNYMKINSGKIHILFSGNDNVSTNIDNHTIISENKNELLGIILDSKLSFEDHINNRNKKIQKLDAVGPYMDKVFKNGPRKICRRQALKSLK